ncbi:hypothetical protein HN51_027517, partial [Arachis hypogaea]
MMRDYSLCCRLQARTNVNNLGERCAIEISGSAFLVQGFSRPDTLFEENEGLDLWLSSSLPLFLPNPMDSTPIFTICFIAYGNGVRKFSRKLRHRLSSYSGSCISLSVTSCRVGLQNVMFASKLGFNLDILEVVAFRKSSIPHGVSAFQPIGIVESGKNIGIEEDFMNLTPRCTVKSLDNNNRVSYLLNKTYAQLFEQHLKDVD